ncbi:hypothetical protein LG324_11695 [Phycicoccus jejuensis]|uniref:hypothetical protein n=1 Tax=Phycicoccus jejuensis TaxID=367299 RepID=UPI00384DF510
MGAPDLAIPMGVLITAAAFVAGAFGSRAETVLARLPSDLARTLDWTRDERDPDPPVGRLGVSGVRIVACTLFVANLVLGASGLVDDADAWEVGVVGVHLVTHAVVLWWTLRECSEAAVRYRSTRQTSAAWVMFEALGFDVPPRDTPGRRGVVRQHLAMVQLAVDTVPSDVPDGAFRRQLAEAHLAYAEVLLDEGHAAEALTEIDHADAQPWSPEWLERTGEHETADWMATGSQSRRLLMRARAHRLLGERSAELDKRLAAARLGGLATIDGDAVVEAAVSAGRVRELADTIRRGTDEEVDWIGDLARALWLACESEIPSAFEPPDPRLTLDDLRLLEVASPFGGQYAERLVDALLRGARAEPDPALAATMLAEASAVVDHRLATDGDDPRWAELHQLLTTMTLEGPSSDRSGGQHPTIPG